MKRYRFPEEQLRLLEAMQIPFAVYQFVDRRVVTLAISDGFCALFGYADRAQAYDDMDHDMYKYDHPDDVARIANAAVRFATEDCEYDVIYRTRARRGSGYRVVHALGKHVYIEEGVRLAYVWYVDEGLYTEDAEHRGFGLNRTLSNALHEESMFRSSRYDELTGLPNMTYFFELADAGKEAILEEGGCPVLLYLNLSGMKFYNTKNGFAAGDKLLQAFSKILIRTFSAENCCRIGADHFALFTKEGGLEDALNRLLSDWKNTGDGNTVPVHIGVYRSRMEKVHSSVACDRAKLACSALKGKFQSGVAYYSNEQRNDSLKKQHILESLDRAIEEKWIQVHYQPIIRASTGRVCDEEALARWIDPVEGLISPAAFIPFLEEAGLIHKLDLYVLDQVLEKIKQQKASGLHIVPHSINLSRLDFDACDMVEEIRRRVDSAGVKRETITIEITESVIGSDFVFMKEQIARFQALGFPVWIYDFGSGYSSLDVLQSIPFDVIKFDMSFMRRLDEGERAKIILTELMKMAGALGVGTVCEGVETEEQVRFLQEIGCSRLQGFYYCKAIPLEQIFQRHKTGTQIGYENPEESSYYEAIGRVNLYDLAVIADDEEHSIRNAFSTLPMGIIEIKGDTTRFVRSNQSYRDFIKRFFGLDLSYLGTNFTQYDNTFLNNIVKTCCEQGIRSVYDEKMPDGSVVHSFARRIGINPVARTVAVAIAVLSVTEPNEGASYADIARALAADYYNIYYVDLETERFIEYSSPVGGEELAMERHGEGFFSSARQDTMTRIYEGDRKDFLTAFTKENLLRELDEQGVFTTTYRLIDTGEPVYVNMKVTRMQPGSKHIIMGISNIDSQMKQQALLEGIRKERDALARVMALSDDYLSLYTINPETGRYVEYKATNEYESLGFEKEGEDFFRQGIIDGKRTVCPEDLPEYLEKFNKETILESIREKGSFQMQYRLMIGGEAKPVSLRIALIKENGSDRLIVGVRAWRQRKRT